MVIGNRNIKTNYLCPKKASYFGISSYYKIIIGSELDGARTQKSEIIACALKMLDMKHKSLPVMIGDRKHDIIGAHESEINSIGVLWGYGSRAALEETKATYIVNSLEELLRLILR